MAVVVQNQTFIDLAIQETGTADTAVAIAIANAKSITDDLEAGDNIVIPDTLEKNSQVLAYIIKNGMRPASATHSSILNPNKKAGIGNWAIGKDFKVG